MVPSRRYSFCTILDRHSKLNLVSRRWASSGEKSGLRGLQVLSVLQPLSDYCDQHLAVPHKLLSGFVGMRGLVLERSPRTWVRLRNQWEYLVLNSRMSSCSWYSEDEGAAPLCLCVLWLTAWCFVGKKDTRSILWYKFLADHIAWTLGCNCLEPQWNRMTCERPTSIVPTYEADEKWPALQCAICDNSPAYYSSEYELSDDESDREFMWRILW
jgi:hypothetical protein